MFWFGLIKYASKKSVGISEGHSLLPISSCFSALKVPHSVGMRLAQLPSSAWCY